MTKYFVLGIWTSLVMSCLDDSCDRGLTTVPLEGTYVLEEQGRGPGGSGTNELTVLDATMEVGSDEVQVTYTDTDGQRYLVRLEVTGKDLR